MDAAGGRSARGRAAKRDRHRLILELIDRREVSSQQQLVELLSELGVHVTQATASRDTAELGLVKVTDMGRHVYAAAADVAAAASRGDDGRLRRVLADYPVRIGRSGLTLLLVSEAGTAGAIGQAIDESTLHEQEGTLAGDNTTLVLFADEARLQTWLRRFEALRSGGRGQAR
jgi:transcriptional regulator of arginine metabolism